MPPLPPLAPPATPPSLLVLAAGWASGALAHHVNEMSTGHASTSMIIGLSAVAPTIILVWVCLSQYRQRDRGSAKLDHKYGNVKPVEDELS